MRRALALARVLGPRATDAFATENLKMCKGFFTESGARIGSSGEGITSLTPHKSNIIWTHARFSTQAPPSPSPEPPAAGDPTPDLEITDMAQFNSIIALSNTTPVLLDAYATWCGPCKQLDPVLKKIIAEQNGAVVLAKLDIDAPALVPMVEQLRISSVPTLFMIMGGRIVDVKGMMPPKELRDWIEKAGQVALTGAKPPQQPPTTTPGAPAAGAAPQDPKALIKEGFYEARTPGATAEGVAPLFAAALDSPSADAADKAAATAGLAVCAALDRDISTAKELIDTAKKAVAEGTPVPEEITAAEAVVEILEEAEGVQGDTRSIVELHASIEGNPKDADALYTLALKLFQAGRHQDAVLTALLLVKTDREFKEQAGKRLVMKFCDALGSDSEVAKSGRRRLSNLWFI